MAKPEPIPADVTGAKSQTVLTIEKGKRDSDAEIKTLPVTPPTIIRIWGHAEGRVTGVTEEGLLILKVKETGEATHTGRYSSEVLLYLNPWSGSACGRGKCTAANQDTFTWVSAVEGNTAKVTCLAGTGRYARISGVVTEDYIHNDLDENGNLSYDYVGQGTVTY